MIKWLKRKLGINYKTCLTCGLLFEPDSREEAMFNCWCPEHRKPFLEQRVLERWAVDWAARKPEEARKAKTLDDMETAKSKVQYNQHLAGIMQSAAQEQANAMSKRGYGLGDLGGGLR